MRSIYSISVWGLAIVLTVAAASARAGMITFEPPTYTAGYSFLNVDGWTYKYGWDPNDKFLITPISGGELRVLSGTQSAVLYQGTDRAVLGRQFDAGTPLLPFDILSWEFLADGTSGNAALYLGAPSDGKTPAGVGAYLGGTGNFFLFGGSGSGSNQDTGIPFIRGHKYLLEMYLDLVNQTFTAYATDITAGGSRTLLGTLGFVSSLTPLTPQGLASNGGVFLWSQAQGTGAVAIFDNINIYGVPEPAGIWLMIGGLVSLFVYYARNRGTHSNRRKSVFGEAGRAMAYPTGDV